MRDMENSLVYYDVGALETRDKNSPLADKGNWIFIKRWFGFDPNFKEDFKVDGKKFFYNCAILDEERSEVDYYMCADEQNNALFNPNRNFHSSRYDRKHVWAQEVKKVVVRRLENVIRENGVGIDILKIDAHGSEWRILNGCGDYLDDIVALHIEIWEEGAYDGCKGAEDVIKYLRDRSFTPVLSFASGKGWIDSLWINKNTCKKGKLELIKNLYGFRCCDGNEIEQYYLIRKNFRVVSEIDSRLDKMVKLIDMYKKMYLIRKVEDVIIDNYYDDEMKTPMHMSRGSEAIAVGVCEALGDRGQYFSTYRSHAPYFASGGNLKKFFAEMYGKKDGRYAGKAGSMHIASPETGHISSSAIVASNIPVAVGAAWANKMKNNGKIVAVFFGEGAMDEGGFWESINMASLWQLPIIFVCEDNRVAVHTLSKDRQGYYDITRIIEEWDIVVGCDSGVSVEDVYNAIIIDGHTKLLTHQPAFLQFEYYRYLEHVGVNADTDKDYRERDSWEPVEANDPVVELRGRLIKDNIDVEAIEKEISDNIYNALEYAKSGEFSDVNETYEDVLYG